MPFNENLPADGTTPWGAALRNAWAALRTFVNALETALNTKAASDHTHLATGISNSTATGRSLITAASAAAARTAIDAPQTAHTHPATDISGSGATGRSLLAATNAAAARSTLSALGSGNGSMTGVEYYSSVAALPATGTAGVLYIVPEGS